MGRCIGRRRHCALPPPAAATACRRHSPSPFPLAYLAVASGCVTTMQTPEQLKAVGNAAFSSGHYAAACEHYGAAIALLDQHPSPGRELAVLYCNRWVLCVGCTRCLYNCQMAVMRRWPVAYPDSRPLPADQPAVPALLLPNRAAAHLKLRDFAAALQDCGAALAVQPRWAKALYRKAAALQGLGQLAGAVEAAQQALSAEPNNKDVHALLKQLEAAVAAAAPTGGAAKGPPADPSVASKPAPTAALLPPLLAGAPFEYVPPADGIHENLLLLFHGLGDKPAAFSRMARQMALPQARMPAALLRLTAYRAGFPICHFAALLGGRAVPQSAWNGAAHACTVCLQLQHTSLPPPCASSDNHWCRLPRWRWAAPRRCHSATAGAAGTLCLTTSST